MDNLKFLDGLNGRKVKSVHRLDNHASWTSKDEEFPVTTGEDCLCHSKKDERKTYEPLGIHMQLGENKMGFSIIRGGDGESIELLKEQLIEFKERYAPHPLNVDDPLRRLENREIEKISLLVRDDPDTGRVLLGINIIFKQGNFIYLNYDDEGFFGIDKDFSQVVSNLKGYEVTSENAKWIDA